MGLSWELVASPWSNATGAVPLCEVPLTRRGRRAHHAQKDRVGTWEIPRPADSGRGWRSASGRRGAEADDARAREVGRGHSSVEAGEPSGAICGEAGGAKGRGQGECGPAKHAPDAEPGRRDPGAGAHTENGKGKEEGEVHRAPPPHSVEHLEAAFFELEETAASGVDGLRWRAYEADRERKLEDLHGGLHRGAYRPLPSRRVFIPKPDGRQRPLAVAALEDKIVQRATVAVL